MIYMLTFYYDDIRVILYNELSVECHGTRDFMVPPPPMTFQTERWGVHNSNPLYLVIIALQYEEILWTEFGEITWSNFSKNSIFLQKVLFSHRQYTYQMNRNCFAVRMQKKIVWSHPRKNFKLLISLNVWTEIRFGQKIRYQHESSRQMICIDNMVLFLAQKFRTKIVFHAYTNIYSSRNFDMSKIILQLLYIIRSGILC